MKYPRHLKEICLYTAAYLEDVISELGLWRSFVNKHSELYGTALPFYTLTPDYTKDEINEEDIRFIIWNTLQKAPYPHSYIHPMTTSIRQTAKMFSRYWMKNTKQHLRMMH